MQKNHDVMVKDLAELAGIPPRKAQSILRNCNYDLQRAANAIFSGEVEVDSAATAVASKIYEQYVDPDEKEIGIDGTIQFIQDLGVPLEDPVVLAVAKELGSPAMGRFPRTEFIAGCVRLGPSMDELKASVEQLRNKMNDDLSYFTEVYRFTFGFNMQERGQRMLSTETAVEYWKLLLTGKFALLDQWVDFVLTVHNKKSISKDTWNMIWDFAKYQKTDPDLSQYDEEAAWPSIIDEFVEHIKS